jgi:hypothetical protein
VKIRATKRKNATAGADIVGRPAEYRPGGGDAGGEIGAAGTPQQIRRAAAAKRKKRVEAVG